MFSNPGSYRPPVPQTQKARPPIPQIQGATGLLFLRPRELQASCSSDPGTYRPPVPQTQGAKGLLFLRPRKLGLLFLRPWEKGLYCSSEARGTNGCAPRPLALQAPGRSGYVRTGTRHRDTAGLSQPAKKEINVTVRNFPIRFFSRN